MIKKKNPEEVYINPARKVKKIKNNVKKIKNKKGKENERNTNY